MFYYKKTRNNTSAAVVVQAKTLWGGPERRVGRK